MEAPKRSGIRRRDALRILAVAGAAGIVGWQMDLFGRRTGPITRRRTLMGTEVHLTLLGDDRERAEAAAEATLSRMADLESLLSRYRDDSEVGRLNASGGIEQPSPALLDVLRLADRIADLGDGAFDVTVQPVLDAYDAARHDSHGLPTREAIEQARGLVDRRRLIVSDDEVRFDGEGMRLTLDGIGKGYIVDRGVETLVERGFTDVLVEAGGDLLAAGHRRGDDPWRVGIRHPRGLSLLARVDATNRAIATSGDYMQAYSADYSHHHIVDPRSGYSDPELASSTVVAPDAATADALATLTLVLGTRRARALIEDLPDCEGYFVTKTLEVATTGGWSGKA